MHRRTVPLRRAALFAALATPAQAQSDKPPLRILVGFPPGGSADTIARLLPERLPAQLGGQGVVVANKPGAGYRIALIGEWHLGYPPHFSPLKSGYQPFFGPMSGGVDYFTHCDSSGTHDLWRGDDALHQEGYLTDLITDRAVDWLRGACCRRCHHRRSALLPQPAPHRTRLALGDA